jgi:hypothetical protein
MSLESEIARLVDVLEKGFAGLTARQSEIISLLGTRAPLAATASPPDASPEIAAKPADIEPPKRGRPRAEPAISPAPAAAPASTTPTPNGQDKGPSFDEVVAIAQELARRKTPPVAIKLINQHGAQKLADMDPANYPAFYAAAMVELAQPDAL